MVQRFGLLVISKFKNWLHLGHFNKLQVCCFIVHNCVDFLQTFLSFEKMMIASYVTLKQIA
jgi:hypothetical protein